MKIDKLPINSLKKFKYKKVQCHRFAHNSTIRELKKSHINFFLIKDLQLYKNYLLKSAIYRSFLNLKKNFNIVTGLFNDHDMCGESEIFSLLLDNKRPLFQ